jgi:protein SCO1/2
MSKAGLLTICLCLWATLCVASPKQYLAQGIVIEIDKRALSIVISCEAIPGYMEPMVMSFKVHDAAVLSELKTGVAVHFTMVENGPQVFAEHIRIVKNVNGEAEPMEAARLGFLRRALDPKVAATAVQAGQVVPDFALTDQQHHSIHLSQFHGKVVALTFAYSRCPNPNYCFRLSNNLAQLQRRFSVRYADDLRLITIVIDPANDQGAALERYAQTWKADPEKWHFLTGSLDEVRAVAELFGMDFWSDEGFLTHFFRTVVIDRDGRLVANLEGNQATAKQLGDLVESVVGGNPNAGTGPQ